MDTGVVVGSHEAQPLHQLWPGIQPSTTAYYQVLWACRQEGHDLACQLQNSGRYTDEAGWRVGEEIEQLWSMGKPLGPLVRYMILAHRRDFIEAHLALVARSKLKRTVQWLVKKSADAKARRLQFSLELLPVTSEAAGRGINDMAAAAERFLESVLPAGSPKVADKDAWQVSYVKLRLKEKELARLPSTASSLAVVSSSSAVTLAAASSCSQVEQVRAELNKLELQHDISPLSA
ncbi:hypothetical protein Vafri_8431 [Volvox africanus]|nr:hypothetical protein Vafri_8431 [Volvox africanus]